MNLNLNRARTLNQVLWCSVQHYNVILSVSHLSSLAIVGVGKETHKNCSMARTWKCLEDYWLCAGRLLVVNTVGTHLRDLINWGLISDGGWRFK